MTYEVICDGIWTPAGLTPGAPTGFAGKGKLVDLSTEQAASYSDLQIRIYVAPVPVEVLPVVEEVISVDPLIGGLSELPTEEPGILDRVVGFFR